ncbi:MAG: hypothetical protein ABIS06_21220 [Vicinamibacterales bacterium]
MRPKLFLLLYVLFQVALDASSVRAGMLQGRNTWSARSSSGQTLAGTWTVSNDPATGSVTGTWTLIDASGRTLAGGGWSAAKAKTGWTGAWRSVVSGIKSEYAGTWSAAVDLKPNAPFADLFERAAREVVSGQWRAGGHSGAWSIRAYEGTPLPSEKAACVKSPR